ncbi:MAG: hypothetical protein HKN09_12310 [Saprospiraceae bacterium]|nr:hypothetical protein [Saprospiraceae bacterium]
MRHYYLTLCILIITSWLFNSEKPSGQFNHTPPFKDVGGLNSSYSENDLVRLHDMVYQLETNIMRLQSYVELSELANLRALNSNLDRYRNGIDILKLLYEKLLDLDHHFTSINAFHEIHDITNLNNYPEFIAVRESFIDDTRQKSSVELPQFLQQNIFVTVGYTLLSSVFGDGAPAKRNEDINDIACLLDFTVSMQSDLKMIYYETTFLHQATKALLIRCQGLFKEYTSVLDYKKSIQWCRDKDEWDLIDERISRLSERHGFNKTLTIESGFNHQLNDVNTNVEFQISRLISLMEAYDTFISQGINYYSKFNIILDNYENENICVDQLPDEIQKLKQKIDLSIQKYTTAYNLAELQGSELKNLMFANTN